MFSNENQMTTDSTLHKHTFKESLEPGRSETQWHHKTYFWPHSSTSDTGCGWRLHSIETKERNYKAERARILLVTVLWTHSWRSSSNWECAPPPSHQCHHGGSWSVMDCCIDYFILQPSEHSNKRQWGHMECLISFLRSKPQSRESTGGCKFDQLRWNLSKWALMA